MLLERGYKYEELYDMTLYEIRNAIKCANKGLAYRLYKQATLTGLVVAGKLPEFEVACAELLPPRKVRKMPKWIQERYEKQKKGGI